MPRFDTVFRVFYCSRFTVILRQVVPPQSDTRLSRNHLSQNSYPSICMVKGTPGEKRVCVFKKCTLESFLSSPLTLIERCRNINKLTLHSSPYVNNNFTIKDKYSILVCLARLQTSPAVCSAARTSIYAGTKSAKFAGLRGFH